MKILRISIVVLLFTLFFTSVSVSEAGFLKDHAAASNANSNIRLKLHPLPSKTISVLGAKTSLIQGDSLDGWTTTSGKKPNEAWSVIEGVLHLKGKGGDIFTEREYKNFVLDFTWKIAKGGNSGIKYRFKKFDGKGWLGCEYQVLDDFNTPEGKKLKNNTATLYDILPTNGFKELKPHEELNHGRIIVNGNHIEHWLNGRKVIDVWVGSQTWKDGVAASKFKDIEGFGENPLGHIMVQDHSCEVWFHEITIREITTIPAKKTLLKKIITKRTLHN